MIIYWGVYAEFSHQLGFAVVWQTGQINGFPPGGTVVFSKLIPVYRRRR